MESMKPSQVEEKKKVKPKTGPMRYLMGWGPNPFAKYPRNLPCYCGSGKKFKKCHATVLPKAVKITEIPKIKAYINKTIAYVSELKSQGIVYKTQQVVKNKNSDGKQIGTKSDNEKTT